MKTHPSVPSSIPVRLALALATGLILPVFAQIETPLPSTVLRVTGHARCSIDGGSKWKLVKPGDIIYAGALVQTAQASDLDLLLGEQVKASPKDAPYNPEVRPGHFISLSADAVLKLDKVARKASPALAEPGEEILLELRTGTVNGNVKKLPAGSKYEITFAGGIAGMREAIYQLNSGGRLNVMKGKAVVALTSSPEVKVVEAGSELAPKVSPPVAIPAAPAVSPATVPQAVRPATAAAPTRTEPVVTPAAPAKETAAPAYRPPLPRSGLRRAGP